MKLIRGLYLENRFFIALSCLIFLFTFGFVWAPIIEVAKVLLVVFGFAALGDIVWLFNRKIKLTANRKMAKLLSLGDENKVLVTVQNHAPIHVFIDLIDELPYQLQKRDFLKSLALAPHEKQQITYTVKPTVRGEYNFGHTVIFLRSQLKLVSRRLNAGTPEMVPVYPSILQMKRFELAANPRISQFLGVKKMRRIGHSYEFEQIKNYVQGDDYRSLNWKATGRHNQLMVNQFQDERSQPVYCIIDKSRQMRLPFQGMSLLDYAINTSLVISNVALQKNDRAGLITFADKVETLLKAENKTLHLRRILEALYNQEESLQEANFELLYKVMKNVVRTRSMIILFTNIESKHGLDRIKPILKRISSFHLLLVVFFENSELAEFGEANAEDITDAYLQSAALRMNDEKKYLTQELKKHGVHTVFTRPEDLSITTLNKYLEFKARGLI